MQTLRLFMGAEAISLAVAAALHAGLVVPGPFEQAAIFEGALAIVLGFGLVLTYAGRSTARVAALATQALALAGACVGVTVVLRGAGPDSPLDVAYHVVLIAALVAGLAVAWRIDETATAEGAS